jgi:hypothetical protein
LVFGEDTNWDAENLVQLLERSLLSFAFH